MDDTVKSDARLEVSVSFGRFENDVLSWEKWSSFSSNKYLEEAGHLSTPGSVAQKKAYFEAHYKKIADKKAEDMELEKSVNPIIMSANSSNKEDCFENSPEPDNYLDLPDGEKIVEECVIAKSDVSALNDDKYDNNDRLSEKDMSENYNADGLMDVVNSHEEKKDDIAVVTCENPNFKEAKHDSNARDVDEPRVNVGKDSVSVELETPKDSRDLVEKHAARKSVREQQTRIVKKENSKSSPRNTTKKVTTTQKEKTPTMAKKKIASPTTKPFQAAASRYSRPTSISTTPKPASHSLNKKSNGSPIPKGNNFLVEKGKKSAPTSLHMSLSLGPSNSLGGLPMTRKSLIMERMGDKDIVKRAFKTFQSRAANGSLMADEKPSPVKHLSSTKVEPKVTNFRTPTKVNIGLRKDTEKMATPSSYPGTKPNPLPSGSHKISSLGRKNVITPSPTTGLKIDEKSEKRKEFLKKLEAKSIAREAANAHISAKSKMAVTNEIHQRPTLSR